MLLGARDDRLGPVLPEVGNPGEQPLFGHQLPPDAVVRRNSATRSSIATRASSVQRAITCLTSSSRSSCMSAKVELTKTLTVRDACPGCLPTCAARSAEPAMSGTPFVSHRTHRLTANPEPGTRQPIMRAPLARDRKPKTMERYLCR